MPNQALPDYAQVAARLGVPRCRGVLFGLRCSYDHKNGEVAEGHVHWADRRPTYAGIRRFLLLAGEIIYAGEVAPSPAWRWRYHLLRRVPYLATRAHVRIPRALGEEDRVKLHEMVLRAPVGEPDRAEALRWLSR
jgi:hypothetical protein